MNIKIIGSKNSRGTKLFNSAIKLADIKGKIILVGKEKISIQKLNDEESINKYCIKFFPGLVVNEKLISQGKGLSANQILEMSKININ